MNKLLCFGRGYVANYLIDTLNDYKIISTKRTSGEESNNIFLWNEFNEIPADTTHILISIPPVENEDVVYNKFHEQIKKLKNLKWLGYLSTTSVYGDHNGGWVDEESICHPTNERSKTRLKIEQEWFAFYEIHEIPVIIFRLSGIYGPKRNYIEKIKEREIIQNIYLKDKYFSRIHVQDIAQVLKSSMNNPISGEIYNLADDYPCPNYEVIEYAYELLSRKPPKRVNLSEAIISPMMSGFYDDNKKVNNNKIKKLLNKDLIFGSYKEGLYDFL